MPKAPRAPTSRRTPLEVQLSEDTHVGSVRRKASKAPSSAVEGHEEASDTYLSSKISRKVLDEARAQQEDDDDSDGEAARAADGLKKRVKFRPQQKAGKGKGVPATVQLRADEDEESDEEAVDFGADDDVRLDGDYVDIRGGDVEATPEEEALLRRFMPESTSERRTLADIIMEKLQQQQATGAEGVATPEGRPKAMGGLDPKVVEVYTEVGRFLTHYKSGALPKVFKVIPALSEWEDVLFLTNPETWTPHATYAATRIFASNFNPAKAQRFFNLVLLPKCRDDVQLHGRMNFHLYLALKKATYKSAAFYKGILLPLAASGDCTLREAVIFGSVVAKSAIPQLHSAAALIKLSQMPYSGAVSIFLRVLVNKKYTLPYMAVDTLAEHFNGFTTVEGPMPVIWHQSLLAFVQRYKADLTAEQKERIKALLHIHAHHTMTPEMPAPRASVAGAQSASASGRASHRGALAASGDALDVDMH